VTIAPDAAWDASLGGPEPFPRSEGFAMACRLMAVAPAALLAALTVRTVGTAGMQARYT
jgi:hypothetical protein